MCGIYVGFFGCSAALFFLGLAVWSCLGSSIIELLRSALLALCCAVEDLDTYVVIDRLLGVAAGMWCDGRGTAPTLYPIYVATGQVWLRYGIRGGRGLLGLEKERGAVVKMHMHDNEGCF